MRTLAALIGASLLFVGGAHTQLTTPCFEDMACWDCTTMGNKICGP